MNMNEKFKILRKRKKWSQAELAEKLEVHITHISRLETGRYTPSLKLMKKLAELYEVTTDYLLYDEIDNVGPINLEDKSLFEKMKLIDKLEEKDRRVIVGVIDAFLVKQQMWTVLNKAEA
jgi:transcriptional regulator with XRE-family HTH domain